MPFLKDAWSGIKNPQRGNPGMTQLAQQLMMGGGATGPIARALNKLAGGLGMMQNNRGVANQRKGILADRKAFFEAQQDPGMRSVLTAAEVPVRPPMQAPEAFNTGSPLMHDPMLTSPLDVGAGEVALEYDHLEKADPWKAIMIGQASEDPMLQQQAFEMAAAQREKGDVLIPTSTGEVYVWDGKDADSMRYLMGGTKSKIETKVVDGNILERDPKVPLGQEGAWKLAYKGLPDDDVVIRQRKEDKQDEAGYTWTETWDEGISQATGDPVWKGTPHSTFKTHQTLEGPALSGDKAYVRSLQQALEGSEDMQMLYQNINDQLEHPVFGQEKLEYFTALGGLEQGFNEFMSWIGATEPGDPSYDKAVRISGFVGDVAETANLYIKEITGAQMSEAEAVRLLKAIATTTDNPAAFQGKLDHAMARMERVEQAYRRRLRALKREGASEDDARKGAEAAAQREVGNIVDYYESGSSAFDIASEGGGGPGTYRPPSG